MKHQNHRDQNLNIILQTGLTGPFEGPMTIRDRLRSDVQKKKTKLRTVKSPSKEWKLAVLTGVQDDEESEPNWSVQSKEVTGFKMDRHSASSPTD